MKKPLKKKASAKYEDPYKDRYVDVPKKKKRQMSKAGKIILLSVLAIVLIVGAVFGYMFLHYRGYQGYKAYLSSYGYEEGTPFQAKKEDRSSIPVEGFVLAAENEYLKLYTKAKTAEVAIYDKRNGEITYSNPQDFADDPIANNTNKAYLRSQFSIKYYNSGRMEATFDSYNDSVANNQVSLAAIKDGIRYTYRVGNVTNSTGMVPRYLSKSTLSRVTGELDDATAALVEGYYKESASVAGFLELAPAALYSETVLADMNVWFEQAGFTVDDYVDSMTEAGKESMLLPNFTIELEYRLRGEQLVVSIPMCSVVEGGGAKIYRISLLNYFGATTTSDEGYMLVPNGSGSLIYLNNGKTTGYADYSQFVYGLDPLVQDYTLLENTEDAKLPVFGVHTAKKDIFAEVEDGSSLALITAAVSGKLNSYNYAYSTFILRGFDKLSMFGTTGNEADLPILESDCYDSNLQVSYSFLTKEYEGYTGMANYYRKELIARGDLRDERVSAEKTPFYYDIIGAYKESKYILGAQYLGVSTATTFAEAEEISKELTSLGVENQVMNFQGWMNGGYYHDVPNYIFITGKLGGKSGLSQLNSTLSANGGRLYGDVAFQNVTTISKRYQENYETSRYYGAGYVAEFGQVNPSTLRQTSSLGYRETVHYLLSPKFLDRYVKDFIKRSKDLPLDGISLRDLGDQLQSDKRRTCVINREEALDIVEAQLALLSDSGKNIMVSDGNMYAFAYADDIINAPTKDNKYYIVDTDVPFYEMIIHGYIPYSGKLMNTNSSADPSLDVLNLIEYGAAPHYIFTYESATVLKYTGLNRFYSTMFDNWKEEAAQTYLAVSEALDEVSGATMVSHEILSDKVRKVTYDNGIVIYVNYAEEAVTVEGISIPAKSYVKSLAKGGN